MIRFDQNFLREQLMVQEALRLASEKSSSKTSDKGNRTARSNHVKSRSAGSNRGCPLCKEEHYLACCDQYKKSAQERREVVNTHQRCWNCLGRHLVGECPSSKNCSKCSGRHHSTLHDAFGNPSALAIQNSSPTVHVAERSAAECSSVLLATTRVYVTDHFGEHHIMRALVDPGSETCLMVESFAQRLRLPQTPTSVSIFGVGGVQTGFSRGRVTVALSSRAGQFACNLIALVLSRLSAYSGTASGGAHCWPHVRDLELADPEFFRRDPVELLLGADAYADVVLLDLRQEEPEEPTQRTRLGWIILGAIGTSCHAAASTTSLQCSVEDDLPTLVRCF
ncbi:uncharacterized protein LOC114930498 [Nylanderia fulva]|uniref:uncharacterized protein LOC114930498 n=1 Tax=Nylanderia fulva TaxID=613905 RepID=UPI0010FAD372|nr:uncharacterized protein LOC114930498 [Nylanderia fulva]